MRLIIRLFTYQRKFVPEIVPLWLKNRNQHAHMGTLMRWGEHMQGWAYTWSSTSVREKVGLSAWGGGKGGGLIGGEIRY